MFCRHNAVLAHLNITLIYIGKPKHNVTCFIETIALSRGLEGHVPSLGGRPV